MLPTFPRCESSGRFRACSRPVFTGILWAAVLLSLSACKHGKEESVVTVAECDEAAVLNPDGQVVLPADATEVEAEVDVDEDMGQLSDLYPNLDTTTDAFYANLPCEPSIGGTLPADEPPTQAEIDAETQLTDFENAGDPRERDPPDLADIESFTMGGCFTLPAAGAAVPVDCNSPLFLNSNAPFEGRDIIYVHGLAFEHIKDRIENPPGASGPPHPSNALWPHDAAEFLNAGGYFNAFAANYWAEHIIEHLGQGWQWISSPPGPVYQTKPNRYMMAAWSSSQSMEFGQHVLLTQIQRAIVSGAGVVTPGSYPKNWQRPFCSNGCIVISHSTGSPLFSSAMGRAGAGDFGTGGEQIVPYMAAHVSFAGAISGSRFATAGLAAANAAASTTGTANALCTLFDNVFGTSNACNANMAFIPTTILYDLVPSVTQSKWGPAIDASRVPTVTFAGGHPIGEYFVSASLLPGIDDGVVSMNSACGNPNPVSPNVLPASGVSVTSLVKAFDMSPSGLARAAKIFIAQKNLKASPPTSNYLAATCTPYLSPTGMVMPVTSSFSGTQFDARKRYRNHYSFVQHLGEHSYDGGGSVNNRWPSVTGDPATATRRYIPYGTFNVEESSAVTDASIYTRSIDNNGTRLAKPIGSREHVRGRKLSFKLFGKRRTWWIWKRTYHTLDKGEQKQSSHYAYEFVGRR